MIRKPIALMVRPHGRWPAGFGRCSGRFRRRVERFAYSDWDVRLCGVLGYERADWQTFHRAIFIKPFLESLVVRPMFHSGYTKLVPVLTLPRVEVP
jgi:hypothetical protein